MVLTRPIVSFDLETTDAEPTTAAIFEFGATVLKPDGTKVNFCKRFKPWKPITPGAEEVTGVTNAMVADCPPFKDHAAKILKALAGKDLLGYNCHRFDIVCLDEEMRRCGLRLDLSGVRVIDVQAIYFKANPRTLTDAVKQYCGRDHGEAHNAGADAAAALDVWLEQMVTHQGLPNNMDAMAEYARMAEHPPVDLAGKLYRNADGYVCFAFGKHKDKRVIDEMSYCWWMLNKAQDMPKSTLEELVKELNRCEVAL
jgi:DNA polymerase-3 subunit epsilon